MRKIHSMYRTVFNSECHHRFEEATKDAKAMKNCGIMISVSNIVEANMFQWWKRKGNSSQIT